jgi:hypothetical protein
MTGAQFFVADLARAGKGYNKIKETVDSAYGNLTLQKMAIYAIIKKVKTGKSTDDMCHPNPKNHSGLRISSPLLPPPSRKIIPC